MDKVFKWISRANGVLLLLLLVGAGIQIAIWNWPRDRSQSRHVAVATEPANTDQPPVPLVFGEVEAVAGSDVLMIPLGTEEDSMKLSSGPRYRHEMRNMLFLAGNGQRATWLFEANGNLLRDLDQLSWRPDRDSPNPTVALYFEYAAADTNGDREIDRNDTFTVALAKPDGSGASEILQGVTRVLSHDLVDEQTMALVYQIDKTIWHARYRVSTFEKCRSKPLSTCPKASNPYVNLFPLGKPCGGSRPA